MSGRYGSRVGLAAVVSVMFLSAGARAVDDNYESNNSIAAAYDLSASEGVWLSAVDSLGVQADDDYYEITVGSTDTVIRIDCLFTGSSGDINIQLRDSGSALLDWSAGSGDSEQIIYDVLSAGSYYISVRGADAGNTYNLMWQAGPLDDNYEVNNTLLKAYDLSAWEGVWLSTIAGPGAQAHDDFYMITVNAPNTLVQVDCTFIHADGDINIELQDGGGTWLAGSTSVTDAEQIIFDVGGMSTVYIRVYGAEAGNAYDLIWQTSLPDDAHEEDDTAAQADGRPTLVSGTGLAGLALDDDYFTINVTTGFEQVDIMLFFTHSVGNLDLRLYGTDGTTLLASSASTTDNETISYLVAGAGTYYVRVDPLGSDTNDYFVNWGASVPVVEESGGGCAPGAGGSGLALLLPFVMGVFALRRKKAIG